MSGEAESAYGPRRAAYDLQKLRGKGMVRKIATSRRYEPERDGLRAMTALVILREKVIRPLLAVSQRPRATNQNQPTHTGRSPIRTTRRWFTIHGRRSCWCTSRTSTSTPKEIR